MPSLSALAASSGIDDSANNEAIIQTNNHPPITSTRGLLNVGSAESATGNTAGATSTKIDTTGAIQLVDAPPQLITSVSPTQHGKNHNQYGGN